MRIETFLRQSAAANPEQLALIADPRRLTYRELDEHSDRLATFLAAGGVRQGDRVVMFMDNVWEAAISIFGVFKAGAVLCPVTPALKQQELRFILNNCQPKAILTMAKYARLCVEAGADAVPPLLVTARGTPVPNAHPFEDCLSSAVGSPPEGGTEDALAFILHTSGSTGEPKGVMMAHTNVDFASGAIAGYLENSARDVVLCVLPLSFTYGLYQLLVAMRVGATLVLEKSFAFPHTVLERARAEGVTGLPLVPTMAAMILSMSEPVPLPMLRYITSAAASLPPAHIAALLKRFPGVQLYSMYGLTECARATYLPPEELAHRPTSVGKAITGTEAFVADESGRPVAPGTIGELVVGGAHVMCGYWQDEKATAAVLRPGRRPGERRLLTGDLFRTDADGFLHFVARKDDIIKIRGEKVAPRRVEEALHTCPGIVEAMVLGRPDPLLGSVLHAVAVRSDPALTERDVIGHCARLLPDVMVPKTIEFREKLPKTASGKVLRRRAAESREE